MRLLAVALSLALAPACAHANIDLSDPLGVTHDIETSLENSEGFINNMERELAAIEVSSHGATAEERKDHLSILNDEEQLVPEYRAALRRIRNIIATQAPEDSRPDYLDRLNKLYTRLNDAEELHKKLLSLYVPRPAPT